MKRIVASTSIENLKTLNIVNSDWYSLCKKLETATGMLANYRDPLMKSRECVVLEDEYGETYEIPVDRNTTYSFNGNSIVI